MTNKLHTDPELERLIHKLNVMAKAAEEASEGGLEPVSGPPLDFKPASATLGTLPQAAEEGDDWLRRLLSRARGNHASDLLIVAGSPPVARIDGVLKPLGDEELDGDSTSLLCASLLPKSRRGRLAEFGWVDFSFNLHELGRFRCNIHRERDQWAAAIRLFPDFLPELEALNLPPALARFADLQQGLVLVTGPTGCGKSTTLAALTRSILAKRRVHLVTIEDPVEYEHPHAGSVVEHVELHRDATNYSDALHSVLHQDPDVILIGEMRDPASISIAITAAETGHLIFSTLHTGDSPQTINRILDSYPANQMDAVRTQLSISLAGVVSQQLLPRKDGQGRVPAVEILVATPAVRNLIRRGHIEQIRSQITLERNIGMLDLDDSLAALVREGLVDPDEARARARIPENFNYNG
jgi:twitching motility protein PilT